MAEIIRPKAKVSLQATSLEREWMGGYVRDPIVIDGKLGRWNQTVCDLARDADRRFDEANVQRMMKALFRQINAEVGKTDKEGERLERDAALYYALKLCSRKNREKKGLEEVLMQFSREQIADRIIQARFDDFKNFYAEQQLALRRQAATEETEETAALLQTARERYDLHARYRQVLQKIEMLERELDAVPFYQRCREADTVLDAALEVARGPKLPVEVLQTIIARMGTEAAVYNQHHAEAESAAAGSGTRLGELRKEKDRLAWQLNREVPLTNLACVALKRRLREKDGGGGPSVVPADGPEKP